MGSSQFGFASWDLESSIAKGVSSCGWENPTEIQRESIPPARRGLDIVGQAKTGSGKTGAFGIPILESCEPAGHPQAIVLCPIRELAVQVAEEMDSLQGDKGLSIQTVYGGTDLEKQAKKLDKGCDIVVGTPGRVIDMTKRGHLDLERISIFCLDEADRMLDMGFFPDVLWILEKSTSRKQTLLFSATFPEEVLDAAEEFLTDPVHIMSDDMEVDIPEIDQFAIHVGRMNKLWALGRIISNMDDGDQMLIFTNTKRMVEILTERLGKFRIRAMGLHGDLSQNKREKIIDSFKQGQEEILVATDVAARGLDVDGINHVINYDLPDDSETYVHRIGRTGRMGRKGVAWSFVTREETQQIEKISSTWNLSIEFKDAPELPNGVDRDPIGRREDWDEVSDVFGMVKVRVSVGKSDSSKRALADWIIRQARVPDIAIGEIRQDVDESDVEIHVDKVAYVMDVIKAREFNGIDLSPQIVGP
ncbi:MAG: ATP-dependent RNA helicase [Euryarchaeota archaeon]|nr:ATP-dependent RNA helicase [Euryarchaeota archaeon]|tara:strand:+ start:44 stop:1468 length:1425 start_codon:yes stop_codon:yes gene_type:complete